ncbi:MAG: resistance protein N-like [Rickettsiaceae bacterium]|jgi:hypothetical protein|nr:resistance protein N-like [Rickettsiaceae bacterium]
MPVRITNKDFTPGQDKTIRPEIWKELKLDKAEHLNCSHTIIEYLDDLPPGLVSLSLENCGKFHYLKGKIPTSLKTLNLHGCSSLESLPPLLNLESLDLRGCVSLKPTVSQIMMLANLAVQGCKITFPENWQDNIIVKINEEQISSQLNSETRVINMKLPHDAMWLDCSGTSLTALPELSPPLTYLNLRDCIFIGKLKNPPKTLETLILSGSIISSLPWLATSNIKYLDLELCRTIPPEEIMNLENAESRGCKVIWPRNLSQARIDIIQSRFDAVIKNYKKDNPSITLSSAAELFKRFLTEDLHKRGQEVTSIASQFVAFIEKNPQSLEWIEEIAERYLQGCVNQPVAGLLEIFVWSSILEKPSLVEKLQVARQLIVSDKIKNFVASFGFKNNAAAVGEGVEIEAGNVLMREVYNKMKENDGIKQWTYIPTSIANEGTIAKWLTQDKIDAACKIAEDVYKNYSLQEIADYMLATKGNIWASVVFPDKKAQLVQEVEQKYQPQKEALSVLYDRLASLDEDQPGSLGKEDQIEEKESLPSPFEPGLSEEKDQQDSLKEEIDYLKEFEKLLGDKAGEERKKELDKIGKLINDKILMETHDPIVEMTKKWLKEELSMNKSHIEEKEDVAKTKGLFVIPESAASSPAPSPTTTGSGEFWIDGTPGSGGSFFPEGMQYKNLVLRNDGIDTEVKMDINIEGLKPLVLSESASQASHASNETTIYNKKDAGFLLLSPTQSELDLLRSSPLPSPASQTSSGSTKTTPKASIRANAKSTRSGTSLGTISESGAENPLHLMSYIKGFESEEDGSIKIKFANEDLSRLFQFENQQQLMGFESKLDKDYLEIILPTGAGEDVEKKFNSIKDSLQRGKQSRFKFPVQASSRS